ncbi:MAG: RluA family pseudouridine synthase [Clostridia bacterium]
MRWTVDEASAGKRLDVYLCENTDLTRSRIGTLIGEGACVVAGAPEGKCGRLVKAGQEVVLTIPEVKPAKAQAQDIPLRILYQDADLAVIFKPSGMVVHPAAGNPDGTLVNALLQHLDNLSGIGGEARPGIVHRIDKDTSGLLLVAKNDRSHVFLSEQIKAHTVERAYYAIVQGRMKEKSGLVDAPIGRHPSDRKKMAIVAGGRNAVTDWTVLEELNGASLIEARLKTGRTHQIRVHMASLGHPVVGDPVYGPKKPPFAVTGGQLLHAYKLGFIHPTTGEFMRFCAEPEPRFAQWLQKLRAGTR